jgi:two-component system, chemotaxis family, chemotaxis protein CheY
MEEKKVKVLLVDDDSITRGLYAEVFKRNGFEVVEAEDGLDGLDKATKETFDIIFTGVIMPRMDGFGLIEALKKNVATSSIPVAMSSHMGREEDQQRAYALGAKEFIARDMNTPNEVVEKIRAILNLVEYKIKFNIGEMDAPQLEKDLHLNKQFHCTECDKEAVISLRIKDMKTHEFTGKFVCPQCGKDID